ncbi:MAG: threonylcarbamoyl-AMP synthase [Puniceicoccales bacterium]|jgi:L-threonylcarbamoyladenylate synthase|nr:threonylcarbamoyl-AMP synthase [Puniceicoccales bacterium]
MPTFEELPPFLRNDAVGLARASDLLREGGIVALPTETVYGLAANALDEQAVRRIFAAKGRPLIDPLIVHVASLEEVGQIAELSPLLEKLVGHFWPGPLTVVLRKKENVPGLVTAGMGTVAVRLPAHPVMREVLRRSGCFLAAPSANPFGYVSPTCAQHVRDSLGHKVPWILDGGLCQHGLESTIIHLTEAAGVRLLRPGPVSPEALQDVLGVSVSVTHVAKTASSLAPGMLERHYSPRTQLILRCEGEAPVPPHTSGREAVVWLRRPDDAAGSETYGRARFWLSEDGSLEEAGRNVFALLRCLDNGDFTAVHMELTTGLGLGAAINDRLRRAAARGG